MTKETPSSFFEMEGRLMIMFGVVCKAAGDLYDMIFLGMEGIIKLLQSMYDHLSIVRQEIDCDPWLNILKQAV